MGRTAKKKNSEVAAPDLNALKGEGSGSLEVSSTGIVEIKEACKRNLVGIDDYVKAIKDSLSATKTIITKDGDEFTEPDHDKRLKAALMGLELEGYIRNKASSVDNSKHTHVTYSWQPVQVINGENKTPRIDVN